MALPQLNDIPKYNITIPSTGKKVRFRPYLVKEEKILLMAVESGDNSTALEAVVDTIDACIVDPIDVKKLTTFDVEFLFNQIRAKSSGESVTIGLNCKNEDCRQLEEVYIKLDDIKMKVPRKDKLQVLNDEVSIEVRFPPYTVLTKMDMDGSDAEKSFKLAAMCVEAVIYNDERIDQEDITDEEMTDFIEQMTTEQFKNLTDFVESMPRLQHKVKWDCASCEKHNNVTIEGMQSFF